MNKNKETICAIKGTFNGLYYWGEGWSSYTANLWNEFWQRQPFKSCYWHVSRNGDSLYLVSLSGSIYLHPMDFRSVLVSCGGTSNGKHFESQIKELTEICEKCAKYCGGTFTMQTSEETKVELNYIN